VRKDSPVWSSQVVVSVVDRDGLTWLHVEDDGAGFGDEDPQRLLKPFERGTAQTKNFERSSYGLGLAIVKRITDWYAASLELKTSDKLGGAKVCVGFNTALAPLV